jgi:hypothetical protein
MGTLTCLISGVSYPIKNDSHLIIEDTLEVRATLKVTIVDMNGTYSFQRGQPITITDSDLGQLYSGYVSTDDQTKYGPASSAVDHVITAFDQQYKADKQANKINYLNWKAGDAAVDMVQRTLASEGVVVPGALHHDGTPADFNTGLLTNAAGYTPPTPITSGLTLPAPQTSATTADGVLEIQKAGADLTITENTQSAFSTGTLNNVQATSAGTLMPTTQSALKFSATYPVATGAFGYIYIQFWSGSQVIGTNDSLIFDVWIPDSAPYKAGGIVPLLSDGTIPGGLLDQNALLNDSDTDLSNYAVNQWYTRTVSLSALSGKTITGMLAQVGSVQTGMYTWYIKNAYLSSHSGSKFFAPTDTTPVVNPPTVYGYSQFVSLSATTAVVTVCDLVNSSRISSAYNIDPVKLLRGSVISWYGSANAAVAASYDGVAYQPCTNNAALPALPVGSNLTGLTLTLKETFTPTGNDPAVIPLLQLLTVSLLSAPNATKSDVVKAFETQTQWNTGTYSSTVSTSSGDLTIGSVSRNWNDGSVANQVFIYATLDNGSGPQQQAFSSVSSGAYQIALNADNSPAIFFGMDRFDFAGIVLDFTIDCDVYFTPAGQSGGNDWVQAGVFYRTDPNAIYDGTTAGTKNSMAYLVTLGAGHIEIGYGSNKNTTDSYTLLQSVSRTFSAGSFVHLKIVVNGKHHLVYVANESTPTLNVFDSTYANPGSVGFRGWSGWTAAATTQIDNFVMTPATSGTWTGPGTSISTLGTCAASVISWTEVNTLNSTESFAQVQTSVDEGSTYQPCKNGGPIPNLPAGTNVSGKSIITKVFFQTVSQPLAPIVRGLVWRVLGAYPGATGVRSTAPMGIDYVVRANQSGFGTASDGQTWTKAGTGTDAVSSDELTISSTTGDVHERLGTRTWTDEDATVRFKLSLNSDVAGLELRYTDTNNYYRLAATSTGISLTKKIAGVSSTLALVSTTLSTGVWYRMRFRIVGSNPALLYGNVWPDQTLEPTIDGTTYRWNDNNWTITASD